MGPQPERIIPGERKQQVDRAVPPELVAKVEQILESRNVGGKVPLDVAMRILDDMAVVSTRMRSWSCDDYERLRLHRYCPRPVHRISRRKT